MPRWLTRLALVILIASWTGTFFLTRDPGADDGPPQYVVEVDNAFGLVDGVDVKLAGVRAGVVTELELDQQTRRALVGIELTVPGFDSLRRDAFCEVRPQSLIGEYYIDCQPGEGERLERGDTLPVERTGSAISFDLLNNVLRRPYNERLRILLGELGAGVAGRGPELNESLRRALPALRESNRVLALLADENRTLARLVRDGDRALTDVTRRREDVGRFVKEAGDTSAASARRKVALADQFRRYPGFLDELQPSMRALGRVSDAQAGSLRELSAASDDLERLFDRLGPFTRASRPAFESLGRAARTGRRTVRESRGTLGELRRTAERTPELAGNAAIVLEHLDDRDNAVEPDARSPGGKGYTGLEAPLQYIFNQSLSINIFDENNYTLKVNLVDSPDCAPYADAERAREVPECSAAIGPNQPGVNAPDPTAGGAGSEPDEAESSGEASARRRRSAPRPAAGEQQRDRSAPRRDDRRSLDRLRSGLPLASAPAPPSPAPVRGGGGEPMQPLLDFLLGP